MSIKTTHSCTREFAIEVIKKKLEEDTLTDEQLANMLEEAIHNGFYNFSIQTIDWFIRDQEAGYPTMDDVNNLPEYNDAW
jgi:ferritin